MEALKKKITEDENGENVPHLEIAEIVLAHRNIVRNDYQFDARALYTFAPNKRSFKNSVITKMPNFRAPFSYVTVS